VPCKIPPGRYKKKRQNMSKNLFFILLILVSFLSCKRDEKDFFNNINEMDAEYLTTEELKEREKDIKADINKYKTILEEHVEAAQKSASYHKMLGKLYFDNKMYKIAAKQFEEAIEIDNENPVLFYYAGLCYARYAKTIIDEPQQFENILIAEKYYLKAIDLNSDFFKALYAVSVLYVFELDQPDKAVLYLEKFLETQKSDYDAMFLLANAYIRLDLIDMASGIYDKIIKNSGNNVYKKQAEENKRKLSDINYMVN
jgi:tetratricopeptide (TPR) repeat protein